MKIAVDAMGGDHAPSVVVEGAIAAAGENQIPVILVGHKETIQNELAHHRHVHLPIEVVHASEHVGMDESPIAPLRQKTDCSIRVAIDLVQKGDAQAIVSAGNTGAVMATAKVILGTIKGVERPGIAAILPSLKGKSLLLDVGANVDCKPVHLLQFAIMGDVYAQEVMGIKNPAVGLLNIGEERIKGNELTKETFPLLEKAALNFIGNVEGRDIYNGKADVIVCDGFIGNIGLKISEGVADIITRLMKKEIKSNPVSHAAAIFIKPAFKRLKKMIDYSEYGGAPLLGVNATCIICHGSSNARAIQNGIRVAAEATKHKVHQQISENILKSKVING
ncbi:MAG: phosphate acyltransferase PlsX [Candidatus Schekmanbacteria bacterium]|nr:phosphate acyltransferase PlsX [Candidatus Schekmanbacteria bacterium]